jgi:hypothetical protein
MVIRSTTARNPRLESMVRELLGSQSERVSVELDRRTEDKNDLVRQLFATYNSEVNVRSRRWAAFDMLLSKGAITQEEYDSEISLIMNSIRKSCSGT